MFKKVQDYLLLHHPLMWNLRVLPMLAIIVCIHILFFVAGYIDGEVDFLGENEAFYLDWTEGFAMATGVLISVLLTVIWLVFYLRNNGFQSYYPKKNNSLYKEWLLLLLICVLNVSYPLTFAFANDLRARNYYDEQELLRRVDVISMVSIFADGSFKDNGDTIVKGKDGEDVEIHRDSLKYGKRYYPLRSLLNKTIPQFSLQDYRRDSISEHRVKRWLVDGRKDSVLWLMQEFDRIAKEHRAVSNLTPSKWLELVYNPPTFDKYTTVGRMEFYADTQSPMPYADNEVAFQVDELALNPSKDTLSNTIKVVNGTVYIYPKYYVPLRQFDNAYTVLSESWTNPDADGIGLMICIYFGLLLSLLIFSFRVTSGRSWLIAIVVFGVSALVIALINFSLFKMVLAEYELRRYDEELYFTICLVIVLAMLGYFLSRPLTRKRTDIMLNILLWLLPWVLPVVVMLLDSYFSHLTIYEVNTRVMPRSGLEILIDDYPEAVLGICAGVYIIFMYCFSIKIKKWKGIAEA